MNVIYIADAELTSNTPGSIRCSAVKDFLLLNYDTHYISLSNQNNKVTSNNKSQINSKYTNTTNNLKLPRLRLNTSFRIFDSSLLSIKFIKNIKKIIFVCKNLNKNEKTIIYVSYKPSSALWLGLFASLLSNGHLLVEYRDLASQFGNKNKSGLRYFLHLIDTYIEKLFLNYVSKVIVVSNTQSKEFFHYFKKQPTVIFNGYDGDLSLPSIPSMNNNKIEIIYAGTLSSRRNLLFLNKYKKFFILNLFSNQNPFKFGLDEDFDVISNGFVDREILAKKYQTTGAFLLIEGVDTNSDGNIPSKVFEYMKYSKPIFFAGSETSDVYKILSQTGHLIYLNTNKFTNIDFSNFKNTFSKEKTMNFSRANQLQVLGNLINGFKK